MKDRDHRQQWADMDESETANALFRRLINSPKTFERDDAVKLVSLAAGLWPEQPFNVPDVEAIQKCFNEEIFYLGEISVQVSKASTMILLSNMRNNRLSWETNAKAMAVEACVLAETICDTMGEHNAGQVRS